MTTLTLVQGENRQEYAEHPTELARKALLAAAEIEPEHWRSALLRIANALPDRRGVIRAQPAAASDDWRRRRDLWKYTPQDRREALLFEVLGDERLTIREIAGRLDAKLGAAVYQTDARTLVYRLMEEGPLERVPEPFRGRVRYRYFRSAGDLSAEAD